ncbi:hypothetical protein F9C28_06265 [Shimwellia pseudoproteus]|uniref:hypothetical protein n=1 Tax=Shimwellia pseudoproteus TaxID=570012 RepID=UPI0018EA720F|nr:hypothetical protein [Shimwellia pseudoproteus]MBJ3814536.1 hypothetical protein [Shimwellia pseudoproteus]
MLWFYFVVFYEVTRTKIRQKNEIALFQRSGCDLMVRSPFTAVRDIAGNQQSACDQAIAVPE